MGTLGCLHPPRHDVAEVAGLTSFSFGDDEDNRYVMVFKKVGPGDRGMGDTGGQGVWRGHGDSQCVVVFKEVGTGGHGGETWGVMGTWRLGGDGDGGRHGDGGTWGHGGDRGTVGR